MAFIENKYHNIYYSLINRAKSRTLPKETYIEKHHIVPKSLGGDNSTENIVSLTAREHFICHWLLIKITAGKERRSMCYALSLMRTHHTNKRYNTPISSRVFEKIRSELVVSIETKQKISNTLKGKKKPEGFGKKISKALKGRPSIHKGKTQPKEVKEKIRLSNIGKNKGNTAWNKGKSHPCSPQTAEKIAMANTGKTFSEEHKSKISAALKKPKPKFTCVNCGKLIGGAGNYKRHSLLCT
jgi:5-methylcytosine-specific restriction endonuclease McrA